MSWSNFASWPKKKEKLRFEIILGVFCAVLIASGIFAWTLYLKNLFPGDVIVSDIVKRKPKIITEISPEIKEFGLKIDKIEVLVPVVKNVDGTNKTAYNKALQEGVAHYKGTALPGAESNIFIFGHSSSIFGNGDYSKVFARLNDLAKDDLIIVFYQNKEYQYRVFAKKVVEKDDISVLTPTKTEQLTLMTCWPIGTNAKRLIIKAAPAANSF